MKKFNVLKYIFIMFVIALIGYAIYYIRGQEKQEEVITETTVSEERELTTITTLRVATVNFDTINPIISKNQNVQDISKLIYEPILSVTDDFQIEKCLAKEWISLSDTVYVVVLKEGIKWQNDVGEVTANDVKFTVEKIQELGYESIYFQNVQNIISTEILSTYTVKFTIDKKIPFFEYNLTFPIMSSAYYNEESMIGNEKNNNVPGTGMYLVGNVSSTEIELKRNPNWWGKSDDKELSLDTILMKLYSSMGEAYNAFKLGNLDLVTTQSLNYEDYIGTMGYKTVEYVGRLHDYLALNCTTGVLANKELRQAINYAIDKSNIVATVYGNKYYVADFPLNTSNFLYNVEKVSSSFNTNKSKELLEEAGWELKGGSWSKTQDYRTTRARINFVVNETNGNRVRVAEAIKKQLEDFGIEVNLIKASDNQYNKYLENKNYDMILTGKLVGISPSMAGYTADGNLSNYKDEEVDDILKEISNLIEQGDKTEQMNTKYKRIIKLIDDERPFISLYFSRNTLICTQDLQGKIVPNFYNIFYNIDEWVRQY